MKDLFRHFFNCWLATLASFVVSSFLLLFVTSDGSFDLIPVIFVPLSGGFLSACLALFLAEEGNPLDLLDIFWYIPITGISVALLVLVNFFLSA